MAKPIVVDTERTAWKLGRSDARRNDYNPPPRLEPWEPDPIRDAYCLGFHGLKLPKPRPGILRTGRP